MRHFMSYHVFYNGPVTWKNEMRLNVYGKNETRSRIMEFAVQGAGNMPCLPQHADQAPVYAHGYGRNGSKGVQKML
ncbi:hypothetical protein J2TS6_32710 [Paenibacillus albilobatus]|uniref:Uncharacterized protein n=1 Tax=Paenibacillus albilobatus TaxID=2716884 RepID=A0A919XJR2_9BACL|nr:hypothetical protein J2TS6_32710 [Paenibacillus albilobatus]